MLQPKADMFDRVEQAITLLKKNLFGLIIPLFVFNFLFFGVISLFFMGYIENIIGDMSGLMGDGFINALYSTQGVFILAILMFLGLLYSLLYIPILLCSVRSIHQAAQGESITIGYNIIFGFKNILESFRTYWYIFKYVYLLPALVFIVGGLIFNLQYFFEISGELGDMIKIISIFIMVFSFVLFLMFAIYRGLRATFILYSAISNESFTEHDFNRNIITTKGNLLRIWGNFFIIGIIIGFISKIVGMITGIFLPNVYDFGLDQLLGNIDISSIVMTGKMPNIGDIQSLNLESLKITFSAQNYIINSFVKELIASVFTMFIFVFTYIFMKRLEVEKNGYINNHDIDTNALKIANTDDSVEGDNKVEVKNNKMDLSSLSISNNRKGIDTEEKNEL